MKHRTQLIVTASGLQASLRLTSAHAALESLMAAVDQYQQKYHDPPHTVELSSALPEQYRWLLRKWLEQHQVVWAAHDGPAEMLRTQAPGQEWPQ